MKDYIQSSKNTSILVGLVIRVVKIHFLDFIADKAKLK